MAKLEVKIREIAEADLPLIYNSWLKSYRESPAVRSIPNSIYFKEHHKLIENILMSTYCQVLVACAADDENVVYGYLVIEFLDSPVVHWAYCKQQFRRSGVMKALVAEARSGEATADISNLQYSHFTRFASKLLGGFDVDAVYNPYAGKLG